MFKLILITLTLILGSCSHKLRTSPLLPNHTQEQHEAFSKNIMITSQGEHTSKAAQYIYAKGGNLFDIAAAMSFVISVERPHSTGLGGGGFLLAHNSNTQKTISYDFRETAPFRSTGKMYLDDKGEQRTLLSRQGSLAVAVPGLVQGVKTFHEEHGQLAWSVILEPAITLARKGFKVYPALAEALKDKEPVLSQFPSTRKIFFKSEGGVYEEGDLLKQEDLALTLERIAQRGSNGFYRGTVAKNIVSSIKKHGGIIGMKDLRSYKVIKRKPVEGSFHDYRIVSMAPPSSGGTHIIQILNILEPLNLKDKGAQNVETIHKVSSAMQIAFADRAKYMGDSDFKKVPVEKIISKEYAKKLRSKISTKKALASKDFPAPELNLYESDDTTHFTIMDQSGNVITTTQTINGWFGSGLVADNTGVVLNNEMDDFASHVGGVNLFGAIGGKNNLIEPYKRPLSSMSPTIVFKGAKPYLALGTPSGTRILTCVMQTILNMLEFDMNLYEAVHATRYHHQWQPEEIRIGPPYFSKSTMSKLEKMGHKIEKKSLGCKVQAIVRKANGELIGVSDNREEGLALGI